MQNYGVAVNPKSLTIKTHYDCMKCPAYCCSYQHIPVTGDDVKRLAKHFGMESAEAKKKFTKKGDEENPRVMRHKADEHYGTVCRFLDSETRGCTIYHARPEICRDFPNRKRCGYYEFLLHERETQEDEEWISTTGNVR
ncbi:MAG: YkgJ family cysteine cluster protein [Pseudomonadota bacterium]